MSVSEGPPPIDAAIAGVARTQAGVISRAQLLDLGVDDDAIAYRVRVGRLHRLYPEVLAVGHVDLSRDGRWLAAVWACGADALLSHRDAAALWGIRPSSRRLIDVSTPRRGTQGSPRDPPASPGTLHPADVARRGPIPVTTLARTLVDRTP